MKTPLGIPSMKMTRLTWQYIPSMKMTRLSPGMLDTRFSTSTVEHHREAVPIMKSTGHLISPITFRRGLCFLVRGRPKHTAPFRGSTPATWSRVKEATPHPAANTVLDSCLEQAVVTAACTPDSKDNY